jgi:hypothetical protein
VPAGILERNLGESVGTQPPAGEGQSLPKAGADQYVLGAGDDAPDTGEVVGQRLAQLANPARIAVADRVERRVVPRAPQRPQPAIAREPGQVGEAGAKS